MHKTNGGGFDDFTKFAGRLGSGLDYKIPTGNFDMFVEGIAFVYEFDQADLNHTQFDVAWHIGLGYHFQI